MGREREARSRAPRWGRSSLDGERLKREEGRVGEGLLSTSELGRTGTKGKGERLGVPTRGLDSRQNISICEAGGERAPIVLFVGEQ